MQASVASKKSVESKSEEPIASAKALVQRPIRRWLGIESLMEVYAAIRGITDPDRFVAEAVRILDIRLAGTERAEDIIPKSGPVVIVCNHPFGAAEGLLMMNALREVRPDARALVTDDLDRIPELSPIFFSVDLSQRKSADPKNARSLRRALKFVGDGGALLLFPAGEVSRLRIAQRAVEDGPWNRLVGTIVRHTRATVVPVHFRGANGPLFQIAGFFYARLGKMLLPRELERRRSSVFIADIGAAIPPGRLDRFRDERAIANYLRFRTYALAPEVSIPRNQSIDTALDLSPERPAAALQAEIERLPTDRRLASTGSVTAYLARAHEFPEVMLEIGRLRERTFRQIGEGTGRSCDIDRFDVDYEHICLWNEETREIVGSYRLRRVEPLKTAPQELYTHSLFTFDERFLERLGPSVELGRSFVRIEYQRRSSALALLWKAIAAWISRRRETARLFGPVSLSRRMGSDALDLCLDHLGRFAWDKSTASLVRPRRAFTFGRMKRRIAADPEICPSTIEEVDEILQARPTSTARVPVLLKRYLELGGRIVGLNVDREFGDAVDALLVVDLSKTDPAILERFFGQKETDRYLARHRTFSISMQS